MRDISRLIYTFNYSLTVNWNRGMQGVEADAEFFRKAAV